MGCVHSSSNAATKDLFPSSRTSQNSGLEGDRGEVGVPCTAATVDSANEHRRQEQQHQQQQRDARAAPEAELPINWNLKFDDLVILEHIANG